MDNSAIRDDLVNRDVALGFGLTVTFFVVSPVMRILEVDPFGNLLARLLSIPGYGLWLGFIILWANLFPNVGPAVRLLLLGLYLVGTSVLLGLLIRTIRQTIVWVRTR